MTCDGSDECDGSEECDDSGECDGSEECVCVCGLVFIIPLHAARRAMAAVVGFSIYHLSWPRPAWPVIMEPPYHQRGVCVIN